MKCGVVSFVLFLAAFSQAEGKAAVGSPVERVVILLKALQKNILDDGEREEQIYNKYTCWVDTVLKKKADAIDAAKAKSKATARLILELKGTIATLQSEIEAWQADIAESVELQENAQAVRQKQNAAFLAETTEEKEAILAMQKAIEVLTAATTEQTSLLQTQTTGRSAVRMALQALPSSSSVLLKPETLSLLNTFMEGGAASEYAPQSVTIQGILRDMYDTFTEDLETATRDEAQANAKYETLIYEQQKLVKGWEADIASHEEKKAKAEADLADATELYDQLQEQIAADIAFFDEAKANGLAKYEEWKVRKSLRDDEVDGIKKALTILTSDDARTLFETAIEAGKATPAPDAASFLQVASDTWESANAATVSAYNLLKEQSKAMKSIRLGRLAAELRMSKVGHFDKVIKSIDNMIAALQEEDRDDIKERDQCKDEFTQTDSSIADLKWKIKVNIAVIADLEEQIAKNDAERLQTIEDIKEVEKQMSDMTSTRKVENADFLEAKKEDEDAIALLQQATEVFTKYYSENNITLGPIQAGIKDLAMVQQGPDFEVSQWQAPEANFKDMAHHKLESKDIVSILTMLTEDLADEVRVAQQAEEDAQLRYEAAMKTARQLKADLIERRITLENMIAADRKSKAEENRKKDHNEAELKDDKAYRASITPDCDWIIGAFEERAKKRVAEMEGLSGAKDFLAGAQEAALLQKIKKRKQGFLGM